MLITFEGIDGCGKTTQAERLCAYLRGKGYPSLFTREPGGAQISEEIRELLLNRKDLRISPITELLLYSAARAQHTEEVISPALERGEIVVCVRFSDSTLAYQGEGRGIPEETVKGLNALATGGLTPRLTLLVDLEPEKSLERAERTDRIEAEKLEFYDRVRKGYLRLAREEPERIRVLDGAQPAESLEKEIRAIVEETLAGLSES